MRILARIYFTGKPPEFFNSECNVSITGSWKLKRIRPMHQLCFGQMAGQVSSVVILKQPMNYQIHVVVYLL